MKLSPEITAALTEHIAANQLDRDDLLFPFPTPNNATHDAGLADVESHEEPARESGVDLGMTAPNAEGRTYPHGTLTAYNLGRCRCTHCRQAAVRYRAQRRASDDDCLPKRAKTMRDKSHRQARA